MVFFGCGSRVVDYRLVPHFGDLLHCLHSAVRFPVRAYREVPEHAPIIVDGLLDQDVSLSCSLAPGFRRQAVAFLRGLRGQANLQPF